MHVITFDVKKLDAAQLITLKKQVYEVYRQIFKGKRYATPDFCDKKLYSDDSVILRARQLIDTPTNKVVGAHIMQIEECEYEPGKTMAIISSTIGILKTYRSLSQNLFIRAAAEDIVEYYDNNPGKIICLAEIYTSPISYQIGMTNHFTTYSFDSREIDPLHAKPLETAMRIIRENKAREKIKYGDKINLSNPYAFHGALIRETPELLFSRLTRGKHLSKYPRQYYENNLSVNGIGIASIAFVDEATASIFRYFTSLPVGTPKMPSVENTPITLPPNQPNTDFKCLKELWTQREALSKESDTGVTHISSKSVTLDLQKKGISHFDECLFKYNGHPIFSVVSREHPVFDYTAAKWVEMIFEGKIDVRDKNVIDLSSHGGSVGLSAILMGAEKVLFSDESPILPIQNHPLIVKEEHEFQSQDMLSHTAEAMTHADEYDKYDIVIANLQAVLADRRIDNEFLNKFFLQVNRVTKLQSQIYFAFNIPDLNFTNYVNFLESVHQFFDLDNLSILSLGKQGGLSTEAPNDFAFIFKIEALKPSAPASTIFFEPRHQLSPLDKVKHVTNLSASLSKLGYTDTAQDLTKEAMTSCPELLGAKL